MFALTFGEIGEDPAHQCQAEHHEGGGSQIIGGRLEAGAYLAQEIAARKKGFHDGASVLVKI